MSDLVEGTYRARGVLGALGMTSTGREQVAVELQILDENFAGATITWFGYFTEETQERTFESLRTLGWKTDDLSNLDGINANEVKIVLKDEEYDGKWRLKVAWINKPGGLALKTPMNEQQARSFAAQMKGRAMASRRAAVAAGSTPAAPPPQTRPAQRPAPATAQRGRVDPAPAGREESPDLANEDIPF